MPIPGTTREQHLRENAAAVFIELTNEEMSALDELGAHVAGARYSENEMALVNK